MNITIKTIPHEEQRYDTVGDFWADENGDLQIRVSEMGDWRKEMAVAYHETFEALLCKANVIDEKDIDAFDMTWRPHDGIEEPGDDPAAPYHLAHVAAGIPERLLALGLNLEWKEYDEVVMALSQEKE